MKHYHSALSSQKHWVVMVEENGPGPGPFSGSRGSFAVRGLSRVEKEAAGPISIHSCW